MVTARERDDLGSPRIRHYLPRFLKAPPPEPEIGDWAAWERLLGGRDREQDSGPGGAMFIEPAHGVEERNFGTVSSSLIALPAIDNPDRRPIWRFASGAPEQWHWQEIAIF
jgi:hypothetical protein